MKAIIFCLFFSATALASDQYLVCLKRDGTVEKKTLFVWGEAYLTIDDGLDWTFIQASVIGEAFLIKTLFWDHQQGRREAIFTLFKEEFLAVEELRGRSCGITN